MNMSKTKQFSSSVSNRGALLQLAEETGSNNVLDIWYNHFNGVWWVSFRVGDQQSFKSFDDLYQWLKSESVG